MRKNLTQKLIGLFLTGTLVLAGCSPATPETVTKVETVVVKETVPVVVTATSTNTPTPTASPTPNNEATVAAGVQAALTGTAAALPTSTLAPTWTATPDVDATVAAQVAAGVNATIAAQPTDTPAATATPEPTDTPTRRPTNTPTPLPTVDPVWSDPAVVDLFQKRNIVGVSPSGNESYGLASDSGLNGLLCDGVKHYYLPGGQADYNNRVPPKDIRVDHNDPNSGNRDRMAIIVLTEACNLYLDPLTGGPRWTDGETVNAYRLAHWVAEGRLDIGK